MNARRAIGRTTVAAPSRVVAAAVGLGLAMVCSGIATAAAADLSGPAPYPADAGAPAAAAPPACGVEEAPVRTFPQARHGHARATMLAV